VLWDNSPIHPVAFSMQKRNFQKNATAFHNLRSHQTHGTKTLQAIKEDSMMHLVFSFFRGEDVFSDYGLWVFLSIASVALFAVFIPLITFIDNRRKEREAFYRSETIRRVAEASPDSSRATIDLLHAQNRIGLMKTREALKIAGIINVGVGVALIPFLGALVNWNVGLCGLIPACIGMAMLVYVYILAEPIV
jgi:hypothetical protein